MGKSCYKNSVDFHIEIQEHEISLPKTFEFLLGPVDDKIKWKLLSNQSDGIEST